MRKAQTRPPMTTERPSKVASTTDPVCGMTVDPHTAEHRHQHGGRTYYFCSAACRQKFQSEPERYLGKTQEAVEAPADAIYTCPMHPQIERSPLKTSRSLSVRWPASSGSSLR